ncbi:MAG TPA: ATP-binding cassette domain-containing protein [bacterium]|nr:ATP-binding cassette domain-containing protein [bacterium]
MLRIENLSLKFDQKDIFTDVSLEINKGEIYALLGRNGTGKSTLAGIILGLITPQSGDIYFEGEKINDFSLTDRAKKGIILAWQKNIVVAGLTVREYIKLSSPNGITEEEIKECVDSVGLNCDDYLGREIDQRLSGGERKRIELASVLAAKPKLAILDEPDSGIDAVSIAMIEDTIKKIASEGAVLLITHQEDIIEICTRAGILCGSKIIRETGPEDAVKYFKKHCDYCEMVNRPDLDRAFEGAL